LADQLKGKTEDSVRTFWGNVLIIPVVQVIVVGPQLKIASMRITQKMALELFKPYVMRELVKKRFSS